MTEVLSLPRQSRLAAFAYFSGKRPAVLASLVLLGLFVVLALAAPPLFGDVGQLNLSHRLMSPSEEFWFGTDQLGRSIFARALVGSRISIFVGVSVALATIAIGLSLGVISGYFKRLDGPIMRIMDGLMAIPGVLLAIALVAMLGPSVLNVVLALTITEIPRMTRLIRGCVLSVRSLPHVDAAVSIGTPTLPLLTRHIVPSTIGPMIVQATYTCSGAILSEAVLSFLGVGTPPRIPSWGNMMSEARQFFEIAPWGVFFPAVFLSCLILAINTLGDVARDQLDARTAEKALL